jgi:plasmid maintenance system antidote protein VapI
MLIINCNMTAAQKKTMTDLLRKALAEVESLRVVERATGVPNPSLSRFVRGEQSLRLDLADKLAAYFGIECRRTRRKGR